MNHRRVTALLASLAVTAALGGALTGCKQDIGERCETDSDCASGTCSQAVPKVCVSRQSDDTQIDATLPCDAPCDDAGAPDAAPRDAARD